MLPLALFGIDGCDGGRLKAEGRDVWGHDGGGDASRDCVIAHDGGDGDDVLEIQGMTRAPTC